MPCRLPGCLAGLLPCTKAFTLPSTALDTLLQSASLLDTDSAGALDLTCSNWPVSTWRSSTVLLGGTMAAEGTGVQSVGKDRAVPALDLAFGYWWVVEGQEPQWQVFVGQSEIFRKALADALLNPRMKRLYFAVNGVWVEMPLR